MSDFGKQLEQYKQAINADIAAYGAHVRTTTRQQYGQYGALVTGAFLDLLSRGGKRIRGGLVMAGYEMCGGRDRQMIVRAATAIEMVHAHLLIIDDIQDRSKTRRGKPTVHEMLAAYHRQQGLRGDAAHAGISLALNAAFGGNAAAQMLLSGLNAADDLKTKVLAIVNLTTATTAHGQTQDIMNEIASGVTIQDVERTMEWKTANYTILNPLCVGMVLAGAGCEDTDAIRDYALHTGKAFQVTDDIMGVFGTDAQTGKSNMDDIREGKRTLLSVYALDHAPAKDRTFLATCLGKPDLTATDFEKCRRIIQASGALGYTQASAHKHVIQALASLDNAPNNWKPERVTFLCDLTRSLTGRAR